MQRLLLTTVAVLLAVSARADALRDPMRPAGAAPALSVRRATIASLKLEGVISSNGTRVAIINGQLVRAGETVAGATILKVLADGVLYARAGREQSLLLPDTHANVSVRVARSAEAKPPEAAKP